MNDLYSLCSLQKDLIFVAAESGHIFDYKRIVKHFTTAFQYKNFLKIDFTNDILLNKLSYDATNDCTKNEKDGPIEQFTTKIEGVRKRHLKGTQGIHDTKKSLSFNDSKGPQSFGDLGIKK